MLLTCLKELPDNRRGQWKMYDLPNLVLIFVLAVLSWSNSYRRVSDFIKTHYVLLKETFWLKRKKAPSYTAIRKIIIWIDTDELEKVFRKYSGQLAWTWEWYHAVAIDGKTMRWSYDRFEDKKAAHVVNVFASWVDIILWHGETTETKTNEIPVVQKLLKEMNIQFKIITLDAMHCQKKQ